ncbi:MAG: hypothetical protein ACRCSB_06555 [Bacteroidales bacterium]
MTREIPKGFFSKEILKGDTTYEYARKLIHRYNNGTLVIRTKKQATIIKRYLAAKKKNFYVKPK